MAERIIQVHCASEHGKCDLPDDAQCPLEVFAQFVRDNKKVPGRGAVMYDITNQYGVRVQISGPSNLPNKYLIQTKCFGGPCSQNGQIIIERSTPVAKKINWWQRG